MKGFLGRFSLNESKSFFSESEPFFRESKFELGSETLAGMHKHIDNFATYWLGRVFSVMQSDIFSHYMNTSFGVVDSPEIYRELRESLFRDDYHRRTEHLFLLFLSELKDRLSAEVVSYKGLSYRGHVYGAPYVFFVVRYGDNIDHTRLSKMTIGTDAEMEQKRVSLESKVPLRGHTREDIEVLTCFSTGYLARHFGQFFDEVFAYSERLESLIDFCSECVWINQDLPFFRRSIDVLYNRVEGASFELVIPSSSDLFIRGSVAGSGGSDESRVMSSPDGGLEFPIPTEHLPNIILSYHDVAHPDELVAIPSSYSEVEVVRVRNYSSHILTLRQSLKGRLLDLFTHVAGYAEGSTTPSEFVILGKHFANTSGVIDGIRLMHR